MKETDFLPFLCVVDIQRGYHDSIEDKIYDVVEKLNNTKQNIIYFFVGTELNLDSEEDVKFYLLEYGLDEDKLGGIRFLEKTYGYFRSWMDHNKISEEKIVDVVSYMLKNKINDSRDMSDEEIGDLLGINNSDYELMEFVKTNNIYLPPDIDIDFLSLDNINQIEIIGGGYNECLAEVNILFKALGKETHVNKSLCYGTETVSNKKRKRFV